MNIESTLIYIFTFMISSICIYLSEHIKGGKQIKLLFSVLGIIIVCLLAAFRDLSVGKDVKMYLVSNYNYAISSQLSFWDYYESLPVDNEILFALLIFVASKIGSFSFLCFEIELLVICPVVYVLKKERERCSVTLGYILFLFLFYNFSLSGMRASIAMSFFILAFYFWTNSKTERALFYCLIALAFQKTTLFILIIFIVIYLIENNKVQNKAIIRAVFILAITGIMIGYSKLSKYIIPIVSTINPRYGNYIRMYLINMPGFTVSNIQSTDILLKTMIVFITFLILKKSKRLNKESDFLFKICLMGRYFVVFNAVFYESMRIAYFFDYFIILFAANMGKGVGENYSKIIEKISIVICAIVYWIYFIMIIGGYGTNIYKFSLY